MASDVSPANEWIHRRFFLSTIRSAPRLFCCNTSDGFSFGQLIFDNDELVCEQVDINHFGFQINHVCWLNETVYRPSRKHIKIGLTTLPTAHRSQQASLIYHREDEISPSSLKWLDETSRLTPSSISYSDKLDRIAVGHLNGTVKAYSASHYHSSFQHTFSNYGVLHHLEWNPMESHLLLLAHPYRINIFDFERTTLSSTLSFSSDREQHLADCAWKSEDIVVGRHRQQILVWDVRASREPIRNQTLDIVGQSEKMKCSLSPPNHLIAVYDSRLAKIKIYDFRFLTMRQVESFDTAARSTFLDYHWTIDRTALVIATHHGLLHWIDVDIPSNSKSINKKQ